MKKLIMTVAVLGCAASIASAQTVTSVNIVGYNKAENATGFQILGTQFDTGDNTPAGVFGETLPVGSKIYVFNGAYDSSLFDEDFLGNKAWSKSLDLGQSVGYWVEIPSGTYTNIISGDVDLGDAVTNSVVSGFQLLSYPYPVERTVSQLGFTPTVGDKIYKFDNASGYDSSLYDEDFLGNKAWSKELVFSVGEGFWYETVVATNWIAVKPF